MNALPGWALLVIYAAGFAVTTRVTFSLSNGHDRADDLLVSACTGFIWPLMLVLAAIYGLLMLVTAGATTKLDRRERRDALEREIRERGQRIAQLEREAGIRP